MATCCLSQTGAIFVLLAISKPCIRFRWSLYRFQPKSPHLSSGTLGFPSWGQVPFSLSNHAYASHTASRISYHVHVMVDYYVVCFFPVLLLWVGSDNVVFVRTLSTTSVCLLHGLFLLSCGILGKMTIPSKSFLSLLASCSLFCYAYAAIPTTCLSCLPYCWTKPLTHLVLANRCLAMIPLCLAPLIALLVAGEDWSLFLVGTWRCCSLLEHVYLLGYHNISYLINASIYLVKGGRLGLMPGVLFLSCRPSFRHTGVMFLDFAFLTRLGYNGNPLIVRLD